MALRRLVTGAAAAALLTAGAGAASAEPVQQFGIQLKDVTADGRYSVVYTSNAFDTTGEAPPALSEASLRLARGMAIKKEFLQPDRLCDIAKFTRLPPPEAAEGDRRTRRRSTASRRRAARLERQLPDPARAIVSTCRTTFLGRGTAVVDARQLAPATPIPKAFSPTAPLPAKFSALPREADRQGRDRRDRRARALRQRPRRSPSSEPWYTVLQRTFTLNVFDDPTPDGKYGYRISLPTERISGFRFSIAELRVESAGLVGRTARGARDFWATPPTCPASGPGALPGRLPLRHRAARRSTVVEVPCPRFRP